jgi:hypothetical protein
MERIFVCDDTYGPNDKSGKYVLGSRKTFVGVELNSIKVESLETAIKIWKNIINHNAIDIERFHFSDIFNRRGNWKNRDYFALLTFQYFVELFKEYQIELFVQTFDDKTIIEMDERIAAMGLSLPKTFVGIDLNTNETRAFTFLIGQIIKSLPVEDSAIIFIDQGIRKKNTII